MNTGKWCSFHFYVGAHEKGGFPVLHGIKYPFCKNKIKHGKLQMFNHVRTKP